MHEPAPHATGAPSAGSMTRVMRAAPASGARMLRVGVVRGGRMIDERLVKRGSRVTVGPGERADVVVPAADLPRDHLLFELSGGVWRLGAEASMRGRVALRSGIVDLGGSTHRIELDASARGKIVVGATTILFQLVTAPPVQPRPRLPLAVTRRGRDVDLPTTIIAALSFLVHFLFVGALYSDWVDPVIDENLEVAGVVETFHQLPALPRIETQAPDAADEPAPAASAAPSAPAHATHATRSGERRGPDATAKARADAALGQRIDDVRMATVGALGGAARPPPTC